ncbi:transcriptional regulator [Citrobacter sp. JGM124]|nr:transcriptional regulator [Citrobacter sp. JGM124]
MIIKYSGWDKCDFSDYKKLAIKYGFNNETSPFFIEFAMNNGAVFDFFILRKNGVDVGACCVDNGWLCNDIKNPKSQTNDLPLPKYSIMPPFLKNIRCLMPFKSKCFALESAHILNASYKFFSKRKVAIAKASTDFSAKTVSTRNREIRKFISDGGSFKSAAEYSENELYDIYSHLYSDRRSGAAALSPVGKDFISEFKSQIVGDIALINDEPVAFQLNIKSLSNYGLFVDFINIGYDTKIKKHSLGTLIMWRNLQIVESLSADHHAPSVYSFGMMSGEYKQRWCNPVPVGKILI